jgi:hypothetical protein
MQPVAALGVFDGGIGVGRLDDLDEAGVVGEEGVLGGGWGLAAGTRSGEVFDLQRVAANAPRWDVRALDVEDGIKTKCIARRQCGVENRNETAEEGWVPDEGVGTMEECATVDVCFID